MKTVLFISFYFPPFSVSGAWRPYYFAKHLTKLGWRPVVVTLRKEECIGHESGIELPLPGTIEIRTRYINLRTRIERLGRRIWPARTAVPTQHSEVLSSESDTQSLRSLASDLVEEFLLYPDDQVGWIPHAVRATMQAARVHGCDVIYATGGPWTNLLVGVLLKLMLRRPLVVEFRDPWYNNAYKQRKFRFTNVLDRCVEGWVLRVADWIVTVTPELSEALVAQHGSWLAKKISTITNGYEILSSVSINEHEASGTPDDDIFRLIHTGTLNGKRDIRPFLEALANLVQTGIIPANKLRLDLIGGIVFEKSLVTAMLAAYPLCEVASVIPHVPFVECQKRLAGSDLLIILQPDAPLQIPRKLFDYLASAKPVLAITSAGATANLIQRHKLGNVVSNEKKAIQEAILNAYRDFLTGCLEGPNEEARVRYTNAALARQVDELFRKFIS